ncbi:hypothetical protein HK101_001159, partial [Irineochytrium annulatum]
MKQQQQQAQQIMGGGGYYAGNQGGQGHGSYGGGGLGMGGTGGSMGGGSYGGYGAGGQQQGYGYQEQPQPQQIQQQQAPVAPGRGGKSLASQVSLDFIKAHDLASSETAFLNCNPNSAGLVTAADASNMFLKSGLNSDALAQIWDLACVCRAGALSFPEFALAMFLIRLRMSGQEIPLSIPENVRSQVLASVNAIKSGSLGSGNATPAPWAIQPSEKAQYDTLFKVWDQSKSGYITGDRARQVFMQSGLPDNVLAHIWGLADTQKSGRLSANEFAVAMHLIHRKLAGNDLPASLPANLIPPTSNAAARDIDTMAAMMKSKLMSDSTPSSKPTPSSSFSNLNLNTDPLLAGVSSSDRKSPGPSVLNAATGAQLLHQRQDDERARLQDAVSAAKRELTTVRNRAEVGRQAVRNFENDVHATKREVIASQDELVTSVRQKNRLVEEVRAAVPASARPSTYRGAHGVSLRNVEAEAESVERDVARMAEDCVRMERQLAERKADVLRARDVRMGGNGVPAPGGVSGGGDAASKTAALLAARMAALGVSAPVGMAAAASKGLPTLGSDLERVEEDRRGREREVSDVAGRAREAVARIRNYASSEKLASAAASAAVPSSGGFIDPKTLLASLRGWEPNVNEKIKYEDGVGIRSGDVRGLIESFKKSMPADVAQQAAVGGRASRVETAISSSSLASTAYPQAAPASAGMAFGSATSAEADNPFAKPSPFASQQQASAVPRAINTLYQHGASGAPESSNVVSATASVNSVLAQAEAAIQAAKERAAQRAAALASGVIPTFSPTTYKMPTPVSAAPPPIEPPQQQPKPFEREPSRSAISPSHPFSSTGAAPSPASQKPAFTATATREPSASSPTTPFNPFAKGAPQTPSLHSAPSPPSQRSSVARDSTTAIPDQVHAGARSAMEQIRIREREALDSQKPPPKRAPPPPVPKRLAPDARKPAPPTPAAKPRVDVSEEGEPAPDFAAAAQRARDVAKKLALGGAPADKAPAPPPPRRTDVSEGKPAGSVREQAKTFNPFAARTSVTVPVATAQVVNHAAEDANGPVLKYVPGTPPVDPREGKPAGSVREAAKTFNPFLRSSVTAPPPVESPSFPAADETTAARGPGGVPPPPPPPPLLPSLSKGVEEVRAESAPEGSVKEAAKTFNPFAARMAAAAATSDTSPTASEEPVLVSKGEVPPPPPPPPFVSGSSSSSVDSTSAPAKGFNPFGAPPSASRVTTAEVTTAESLA